jgi:MFS superfamily sulfate permease-like transporter
MAESAGVTTQITGLVGALCIAIRLVYVPTLLQSPLSAELGAVVVSAGPSLIDHQREFNRPHRNR